MYADGNGAMYNARIAVQPRVSKIQVNNTRVTINRGRVKTIIRVLNRVQVWI